MGIPLCTVEDVAEAASADLAVWGDRVSDVIDAASAAVETWCGRRFHPAEEARRFRVGVAGWVDVPDINAVDTVAVVDGDVISVGSVELWPVEGPATAIRVPAPPGAVIEVEGTWGHPQVPDNVREAVVDTAVRWLSATPQDDRPDDIPTEMDGAAGLSLRAQNLLAPYRRTVLK